MTVSTLSGRASPRSRFGETMTATRSTPASRAAITGHAIIGRPQTGWRTLGRVERMRVPSPAAMISAVVLPVKLYSLNQGSWLSCLARVPIMISVKPAKMKSIPSSRPIAQSLVLLMSAMMISPMISERMPFTAIHPAPL